MKEKDRGERFSSRPEKAGVKEEEPDEPRIEQRKNNGASTRQLCRAWGRNGVKRDQS